MDRRHCIGLIGGLGVGATTHYYKKLAEAHAREGLPLDLVMVHASTPKVFEYAAADDREGLAKYLRGFIDRLEAAGAELIVIPAVTPHLCMRELLELSPLPVLNIFGSLAKELTARSIGRAGVFGTRFVIESALFGMVDGIELIPPQQDELELIHRIYVEVAQTGKASEAQHRDLTTLAVTLCARESLDAIILAGTDLSLIFDETNTEFPSIDCAALHIEAIMQSVRSAGEL